jgi:EmrB/QacA subfamily drug resistance transporter
MVFAFRRRSEGVLKDDLTASAPTFATASRATPIWLTMVGLLAALALAALDMNIVNTALPIIASEFGGLGRLSWVVTSFILAQSATLLIYGKLSDMYGRRPLFLFAVGIFVLGSLLCGAAQSMAQLIAFRALQGVGAAGLFTLSSATLADLVSPRERGRYQSLFTATFAVCSIAGPLVGGGLTSLFGWRSVFLINLPLGLATFVILACTLPHRSRRHTHQIDVLGAGLIVVMTTSALLALSWDGPAAPWRSPIVIGFAALSLIALGCLILQERRAREPVLDLSLFRDTVFTRSALTNAMVGFPFMGSVVFLPLYLQLVRGFPPAQAGLIVLPQLVGLMSASIFGGLMVSRFGRYKPFIVVGVTLIAGSLTALGVLISSAAPLPMLMGALLVLGTGGGLCMPNLTVAVQNAVRPARVGAATAFLGFSHALASASGIAISGSILANRVRAHIATRYVEPDLSRLARVGVTELHRLVPAERAVLLAAYQHAIAVTFMTSGVIAVITIILSTRVPNRELSGDRPMPALFED